MMKKSASDLARPGFTLIEAALAAVLGSSILLTTFYAFREGQTTVQMIYQELLVQDLARDMQQRLDGEFPGRLSGATPTLAMDLVSADGSAVDFGVGGLHLQWRDGQDIQSTTGGALSLNDGVATAPVIGVGARGMLDWTSFGYQSVAGSHERGGLERWLTIFIDPRVQEKLLRIWTRLARDTGLPLYVQGVYAPRVLNWSALSTITPDLGGGDDDGDGVTNANDTYPWDPERSTNGVGNFLPLTISESTVALATVGQTMNAFEGTGSGNFGWVSWNGEASANALAGMLTNPAAYPYNNPDNPSDHSLELLDWVRGNTGISNSANVRNALDTFIGRESVVLVWNTFREPGSNRDYRISGFARVTLTGYDLSGKSISATYLGPCDRDGNLLPSIADGRTPAPTTAPSTAVVSNPTPAPTATPTPAPSASASASASPSPSPSASAAASPSPSASPTATPTPTPPPSDTVYAVLVKDSLFAGQSSGYETGELTSSDSNWRWACWNTGVAEADWTARLTHPGNSSTYINPLNAGDSHLDVGDKVTKHDNLDNWAATVGVAIQDVITNDRTVIVVLYSSIDASSRATITGFANVKLRAYRINGTDRLQFRYLGTCRSDGSAL
ncbi:MAG: hypothetical protein VKP62_05945 [Candidatus Sericytochromatia bacterium]|nr:hypothetical protein [Candidatus Sericytochromatia bacterium]